MSVQAANYYWLTCDWRSGCSERSTDSGEYGAWDHLGEAISEAYDADWFIGDNEHFCAIHSVEVSEPAEDASDEEWAAYDDAGRRAPREWTLHADLDILLEELNRKIDVKAKRALERHYHRVRDWENRDRFAAQRAARDTEFAQRMTDTETRGRELVAAIRRL